MKKVFSILLLIFIPIFCLAQKMDSNETPVLTEENPEKAYENVLCSAVCIHADGYYGSGSIFEIKKDDIIIVTNKHLTSHFDDNSYVTFFNGLEYRGFLLGESDTADIGFISVPIKELDPETKSLLKAVTKQVSSYDSLKENSCFFMIDLASDIENPALYKGVLVNKEKFLTDYDMEMLYANGAAVPGMSGSGIFDYFGNYIGTLSGATPQYELAGVPLPTVLAEYKKLA